MSHKQSQCSLNHAGECIFCGRKQVTHKDTELDTQELREQVVEDIETAAVWREHVGAIRGESMNPDRIKDRRTGSERVADLIMEKVEAHCAQREQAAELRGRTTVLKKLASKTTPRYEDTHPEYTKGFEEMKSKVKFELQRLQATKPEKGEQP